MTNALPPSFGPKKLNWWYEDIINWMLINPGAKLGDAAEYFGKTQAWLSVVINSDIFKARLEERRKELNGELDDLLVYKMKRVANESFDALMERILSDDRDKIPIPQLLDIGTKVTDLLDPVGVKRGKGKGNRGDELPQQQVNVQVVVPVTQNALEEARGKIRLIEEQKLMINNNTESEEEKDM